MTAHKYPGELALPLPFPWLEAAFAQAVSLRGHALLLLGGEGRGLYALAMHLAHHTLCSAIPAAARPCGTCADCQLFAAQTHPDLTVLVPDAQRSGLGWRLKPEGEDRETASKKSKPSEEILVSDLRQAIAWGTTSPARGGHKVMLIHPASKMSAVTANALLKTLEEPPGGLKLILTAKAATDVLPTISSRCQHVMVPLPSLAASAQWLADSGVVDAAEVLRASGGEPLDARAAAQRGLTAAWWRQLPRAMQAGDASVFAGWSIPHTVDALQKLCHDTMAVKAGAPPRFFAMKDLNAGSGGAPWDRLRRWSLSLSDMARVSDHTWSVGLALDALVSQARHALQEEDPALARSGEARQGGQAASGRRLGTLGAR
jgi:DNA polymerase III subunit delta'